MLENTVVLKFGSSVLRTAGDLHVAVDETYRHWRERCRVLAVVSAFEGITDTLMAEIGDTLGSVSPEATAAYAATGEQQTAALLLGSLIQYGLPARLVTPSDIGLVAQGPLLESTPVRIDASAIEQLWRSWPILVLPGFYGVDSEGRTALFGRGGSDTSALFLANALGARCRLLKDVCGVFDADPASNRSAHRFSALSWARATQVAGPLIQPKALQYAHQKALAFEVGRPNEAAGTAVGNTHDAWAPQAPPPQPLRLALYGCGIVGRGVYETVKRYPEVFDIRRVVVREPDRYPGVDRLTTDPSFVLDEAIDVVVMCVPGIGLAYPLMVAALNAGKFVVTPNKAAIAAHGMSLTAHGRGSERLLWYSAAVGGALPVLETLASLKTPVREIRGIINGTFGVVLEAWARGRTRPEAVAAAQAGGFAEADPIRDLSGRDAADKLALLIEAAFGRLVPAEQIETAGIDAIAGDPAGYKLLARATRTAQGITARVAPERPAPASFFGQASGAENRLEIELEDGEVIRLQAQGAGRWPTTVSVMGDLHEIARRVEITRQSQPTR